MEEKNEEKQAESISPQEKLDTFERLSISLALA